MNREPLFQPPTVPKYQYDIPADKVGAVGNYLLALQKKHPTWNKARVMRKAAEHFNLKKL